MSFSDPFLSQRARKTKEPGIPALPDDAGPKSRAWMQAMQERMEVLAGDRGFPLDRAVRQRDLSDYAKQADLAGIGGSLYDHVGEFICWRTSNMSIPQQDTPVDISWQDSTTIGDRLRRRRPTPATHHPSARGSSGWPRPG